MFFSQVILTFLFVLEILVIKGKITSPTEDGAFGAFAVALALYGLIKLDDKIGACFNPAVGLVQSIYGVMELQHSGLYSASTLTRYMWAYILGPAIGGLLAGIAQLFHRGAVGKVAASAAGADRLLD